MSTSAGNLSVRVFEEVLEGGLGKGNVGAITAHHGTGENASEVNDRGEPTGLAAAEEHLEPSATSLPLRFVKLHGKVPESGVAREVDQKTMLLRWR